MEQFIEDFQKQIQQLPSRKLMLAQFGDMLPDRAEQMGLTPEQVPMVIASFKSDSKSTVKRPMLVEICRKVLTEWISKAPKVHDCHSRDKEPVEDEEPVEDDHYSDASTDEEADDDEEILSDIDRMIETEYLKLKDLSPEARKELNVLVIELVNRYRL